MGGGGITDGRHFALVPPGLPCSSRRDAVVGSHDVDVERTVHMSCMPAPYIPQGIGESPVPCALNADTIDSKSGLTTFTSSSGTADIV